MGTIKVCRERLAIGWSVLRKFHCMSKSVIRLKRLEHSNLHDIKFHGISLQTVQQNEAPPYNVDVDSFLIEELTNKSIWWYDPIIY